MSIAVLLSLAAVATAQAQSSRQEQRFPIPELGHIQVADRTNLNVNFVGQPFSLTEQFPTPEQPTEMQIVSPQPPPAIPLESVSHIQDVHNSSSPVVRYVFDDEVPSQPRQNAQSSQQSQPFQASQDSQPPQPFQPPKPPQPPQPFQPPKPPQDPQLSHPSQPLLPSQPHQPTQPPQNTRVPHPTHAPQPPKAPPSPLQRESTSNYPSLPRVPPLLGLFGANVVGARQGGIQLSSDRDAVILRHDRLEPSADGVAGVSYETSNGINVVSRTSLDKNGFNVVEGSYSYLSADGVPVHVRYIADRNGYRYTALGLPVGPEIPPHAQEQIERGRRLHEEAARRRAEQRGHASNFNV